MSVFGVQVRLEVREHHQASVAMTGSLGAVSVSGVWRGAQSAEATAEPPNEETSAPPIAMATSGREESRPETHPMTAGVAMGSGSAGTTGKEVRPQSAYQQYN